MSNNPDHTDGTAQQAPLKQVSNWNIPNALTTLRLFLVPFYGWALLVDGGESVLWRCVAFVIFAVAMVTDKVDGDIARSRGLITNFGKIADPITDKAITGMAFIGLAIIIDTWWMWAAMVVVLLREWSVTLLRLSILKRIVIAAAQSGKIKTTAQGAGLGLLTLPLLQVDGALDVPGEVLYVAGLAILAVAVALTVWSGYQFFRDVWKQRHDLRSSSSA